MKILYLIGNGFDINVGLNTSYQDFLKFYLEQPAPKELDEVGVRFINRLKEEMQSDIQLWSDLELQYGKHMARLGHMGSAVHPINDEFDIINDDIRDNLSKYIATQEKRLFFTEDAKKRFLADLADPEAFFRDYEKNEVDNRRKNFWYSTGKVIDIITFNYTRTIETLLGKTPAQSSGFEVNAPIHVHGYYDSRMIMGVNDASQIDNEELRNNTYITDALVKSKNNHAYGISHTNKCNQLIKNAQLICIYGLSFGETDKMWWQKICKELKGRTDLLVLVHWYVKDLPDYSNSGHKLQYLMNQTADKLLSLGGIAENERSNLLNRIYVTINSPKFNFKIEED